MWATQKSANEVIIEHANEIMSNVITDIPITELTLSESYLVLTNGRNVNVYKLIIEESTFDVTKKSLSIKSLNNFVIECLQLFIYDQTIIALGQDDVKILSLGGIILQNLSSTEVEGIIRNSYQNQTHVDNIFCCCIY